MSVEEAVRRREEREEMEKRQEQESDRGEGSGIDNQFIIPKE